MPRKSRKKSESGIYHIMMRGINQQQLFEENEDREKFIDVIKKCKEISEFKIYAYCLMGNHVHLLLRETKEPIEQIMKRLATRYVYWYNTKYQRTGHLFQDRFRSESVDDEKYFLTVLRYIHRNPIKAGICKRPEDYKYSSFGEYIGGTHFVDIDFVFDMMSRESFIDFNDEFSEDVCLDVREEVIHKVTEEQAQKIIEKYSNCKNATEFQILETNKRNKYLKKFKEKGLSIRQISRLTGIGYSIIQKA